MNNNKHNMDNIRKFLAGLIVAVTTIFGIALVLPAHAQITIRGSTSVSTAESGAITNTIGGSATRATSGNLTLALPTLPPGLPPAWYAMIGNMGSWRENDLFLAVVTSRDNVAVSMPTGWTLLNQGMGAGGLHQASIFWKRAVTGETAPVVTHPGGGLIAGIILNFRGVDLATPFDVTNSFTSSPSDLTVEAGSITTTQPSSLLFASLRGSKTASPGGTGDWPSGDFYSIGGAYELAHPDGVSANVYFRPIAASGIQPAITYTLPAASGVAESHGALIALRVGNIPSIPKPVGTVANDVMVATLAVQGSGPLTVAAPSGWTLVRRMYDSGKGLLEVYIKTAGTSEPASYSWSIPTAISPPGNSATLSITSFAGVDPLNPIDVEAGQNTANGLTHATPSVTTTMANAMLVTSHATDKSVSSWTPPAGLTQAIDLHEEGNKNRTLGSSLKVSYVIKTASGSTSTQTATITSGTSATGHAHILALRPAVASRIYFVHTDHLNTPRLITSDTGQAVWTWANDDPYGNNAPNENPSGAGNFTCNLRLPGQYFDTELGTHYNYFRDYDPLTGRYVQSDPIGLEGGFGTYSYTNNAPVNYTDPLGLLRWSGSFDIKSLGYGKAGGSKAEFNLVSDCDTDNNRGVVQITGYTFSLGLGAPMTGSRGTIEFEDAFIRVNRKAFEGNFTIDSIGGQIGSMGLGRTNIHFGTTTTKNINSSAGFDFGIQFGIFGRGKINRFSIEQCGCEKK